MTEAHIILKPTGDHMTSTMCITFIEVFTAVIFHFNILDQLFCSSGLYHHSKPHTQPSRPLL